MKLKSYKWFRGLLKASALTSVMFVMQACYGSPKSSEFRDAEKLLKQYENEVDKARDCNALNQANVNFLEKASKMDHKSYKDDTINEAEGKELEDLAKGITEKVKAKEKELCAEEEGEE